MIQRSFDAAVLNAIQNDPSVRPHIVNDTWTGEDLDCSAWIADRDNYLLTDGEQAYTFTLQPDEHGQSVGVYELHSQSLVRGPKVVRGFPEALRWMFCRTDCEQIVTMVPEGCTGGNAIIKIGRFQPPEGVMRDAIWPKDGKLVPLRYYWLNVWDWMHRGHGLEAIGAEMHRRLHVADVQFGRVIERHPDCPVHNTHSGALIAMILGGQVDKAVYWYNRIARFYRYEEVRWVARGPEMILDLVSDRFAFKGGDYEVLPCPG